MPYCTLIVRSTLAIAFAIGLNACGGGGGGASTPPPPAGLTLTVKVNNVAVTPSGTTVAMGNGDTVTVESSAPVLWVTSAPGAQITNNVMTQQSWTARIAKTGTASLAVSLQATAGTETSSLVLFIPLGDLRNGEYKLFSANANEYRLRMDFDARQYSLLSGATVIASSTFTSPVDGTYTFDVPGYAPVMNNARFRTAEGLIVGSHPTGGADALPFVAANNFVTSAADLPLTNMWIFMSDVTPSNSPAVNTRIQAVRIFASQISYCSVASGPVTTVANCLPGNLFNYSLTFNADRSITWLDDGVPVNLHVVRAGGELFIIRAQSYPTTTGNKRFQIALDDSHAVSTGAYESGISNGSWGTATIAPGSFSRPAVTSAGAPDNVNGALVSAGVQAQPLQGAFGSDGVSYFVQSSGVLGAHIAARGSAKAGLIGVGLKR